ncbi:MAG: N-6 DNA methylase [Candidatus Bathyarchaeia archaeon]|jgi:type I restriction enzyme M protein
MSSVEAQARQVSSWFNISENDARLWIEGKTTLERLLNLTSEDAIITHFLVPLLQNALGYKVAEIDIKPQLTINYGRQVKNVGGQSDIIARKGTSPVVVIEVKSYGHELKSATENAEGQAFDYTRANELKPRPKYHMTTNVEETHIYETLTRNELIFSPIKECELLTKFSNIDDTIGKLNITPLGVKIVQTALVRAPVTDQRDFERILYKCQDDMREASESKTGLQAFAEINKLLFIKLYEDRRERDGKDNRFTSYKIMEEGENYIRGTLFQDIKDHYKKRNLKIFRDEDAILLDDVTVNKIVERLEKLILVDDERRVYPPVAHVYENFVSTIFRGENGQYFTPRKIVDFIVKIAQVSWGSEGMRIVDPACGSGGFLLSAFATMHEELKNLFMEKEVAGKLIFKSPDAEKEYRDAKTKLCEGLLVGFDNEEIIAKTSAMNMSVHGDGSTGIHFGDSLQTKRYGAILASKSFKAALTNPPFSSEVKLDTHIDIDGHDILESYELAHSHHYIPKKKQFKWSVGRKHLRQQDSKVLFIERCHELLEDGGTLGIIVDDGVINNATDGYIRDYIKRNFVIKAVVALPFDIFKEQDAHNYTSILLLQKKKSGLVQGDIFMAIAEHCGENFGKSTIIEPNDLEEHILPDYLRFANGERTGFSHFSFVCKREELEDSYEVERKRVNNRLDPKFYSPRRKQVEEEIQLTGSAKPIGQVVDFKEDICSDQSVNEFGSKYIVGITHTGLLEIGIIDNIHDPKGKKDKVFRAGELVVSKINLKDGMIAIVPADLDEVRGTIEHYKLVAKKDTASKELVDKKYLKIVLTSEPIQYLLRARATGQYGRLNSRELAKIAIPIPDDVDKQREIVTLYEEESKRLETLIQQTEEGKGKLLKKMEEKIFARKA